MMTSYALFGGFPSHIKFNISVIFYMTDSGTYITLACPVEIKPEY